jgi:hypothetical protein
MVKPDVDADLGLGTQSMVSRGSHWAIPSNAADLVMIYSLVHLSHPFVIRLTELIITVNISVILATLMNSWTLMMRFWFT